VAVSNIITVLCAPNLEVAEIERNCNEITLEARKYDDPSDLIDFWWQISKDGKNWSTLNVPKNTYNLEYTITSDSYIRIYTDMVASKAVKVSLRGISLTSQPAKTYIGSSVKLTAATIKYELEDGEKYQWFEKDLTTGTSDYSPLEETTNSFIYYTLQSDKASIKVVAEGCEAEVTIEELELLKIAQKSRDCNEVTIEGITDLEPSKIKWYYSLDGTEYSVYSQVGTPIIFNVSEENKDGVYVKGKTTDGKESAPIKVYPIVVENTVYNALNEEFAEELLVLDKEQITIKTEISGIEMSASDVVIYKSCTGDVLAQNSDAEFTTNITKENKCFVTEYKGCVSENIEFSIKPQELIWPTAFNPLNNDGVNDTFMQGYGIKMLIMDRYGNVVSESEDGWDGTIKGANAMPGVYFYVATLPDETVKKGTIELVHYVK
jgi:gliding motility-associated-like protein